MTYFLSLAAAQNTEKAATSSKQYILATVLPEALRDYEIVQPHGFKEQTYTGLVTMIVSLIYLNGCILPENKLNRYLSRMNADDYTPIEKTEKVIATMIKQGYIVKQKDDMGEGGHDYYLGPRAKVEIGSSGVLSMLKTVSTDICLLLVFYQYTEICYSVGLWGYGSGRLRKET